MKTAIGIRVADKVDSMFFNSLIKFLQQNKTPDTILLPPVYGLPYHVAANEIGAKFIDSNYDNLLFLDDDMVWTYDDFLKIKKDIEDPINKEYGIIGGLYPTRRGHIRPLVMFKEKNGNWLYDTTKLNKGINKVDGCGLGFTMIKRECFMLDNFIDKIYFRMEDLTSEDVYFCERVIEKGYLIGIDTDISLGHRGTVTIKWNIKDNKPDIYTSDVFGQDNAK